MICVSVTFTITLLLLSVGSFFRAFSICERIWSVLPAAVFCAPLADVLEDWPLVLD